MIMSHSCETDSYVSTEICTSHNPRTLVCEDSPISLYRSNQSVIKGFKDLKIIYNDIAMVQLHSLTL